LSLTQQPAPPVLGSALLPPCYCPATWPATACNHLQPPATRPGARHPRTYRVCSATPRCALACHVQNVVTTRPRTLRVVETSRNARQHASTSAASQHPSIPARVPRNFAPPYFRSAPSTPTQHTLLPFPALSRHVLPACLPACPTPRRVRRQRGIAVGHRPVRLLLGTLSSRKFAQTFPSPIQTLAMGIVTTHVPSPFFPLPLQPHASCRACLCDTARMPNAPNALNAYPGLGSLASVACCSVAAHRIVP
jgi:hypothetical protein